MPSSPPPLWPATLHHLALESPDPDRLAEFLAPVLQMQRARGEGGQHILTGPGRLVVVGPGPGPTARHVAFGIADPARLVELRARLSSRGAPIDSWETPFFRVGSFRVTAPEGVVLAFGVPADATAETNLAGLSGRLQHAVFRTPDPEAFLSFVTDDAGFVLSDRVENDDRTLNAGFVRSDPEHHSLAAFRASEPAFDHYALEADAWNDLRDWGDHFASLRVPIWWGPGRHGPGNNLFLMIRDPDGNRIEISAELEHMDRDTPHRTWPLEERTLNLWGNAWMRA